MRINYTDEQINNFLELAQETGITRAKRELGYPNSWDTANRWAQVRGIDVAKDEIKMRAASMREWYKDDEVITIAQEGMNRVYEELVNNINLTADDQNKLGSALTKHYQVWANVQGKAAQITETRSNDGMDAGLMALLENERLKNLQKKESVTEVTEM